LDEEFLSSVSFEGVNQTTVCTFENDFYYIHGDGTKSWMCIGYNQNNNDLCPANLLACAGGLNEEGLPVYGSNQAQINAVKAALNTQNLKYPYCPI
jgi:hypothetical protein